MESVIREEDTITVYDILEPILEIFVTYFLSNCDCPPDLRAVLDTIIYASTRIELEEFRKLRELVMLQYGEAYINKANSNVEKLVNVNLIEKLKVKPVAEALITIRLKQLCINDKIKFEFPSEFSEFISRMNNPFSQNEPTNPYSSQIGNPYQSRGVGGMKNSFNSCQ